MPRIAVIIPAFNEEKAITGVVEEVNTIPLPPGYSATPVVINDCSRDRTGEIIDQLNCIALQLPVNLGIGGAVQTGWKFAFENGYDYAVQLDGDGQHPAHQIPDLLQAMQSGNYDVMIGSRFLDNSGFQSSAVRRLGIHYFRWLNNLLVGVKIYDSTSGFRMLNRSVLKLVSEHYPDEYPEPEAIILYSLNGFRIGEKQVTMRDRQGGVSSINSISAIYYMFKVSLAILYTFIRIKFRR